MRTKSVQHGRLMQPCISVVMSRSSIFRQVSTIDESVRNSKRVIMAQVTADAVSESVVQLIGILVPAL